MKDDLHYSGTSSFKYIDQLIENNDDSLEIISPFISKVYIKRLVDLSKRKKIRVITSDKSPLDYKEIKKYTKKSVLMPALIEVLIVIFYILLFNNVTIMPYVNLGVIDFFVLIIIIIINLIIAHRVKKNMSIRKKGTNIEFKVVKDRFIHEKLYISDSEVITGSANFTFSGLHKNIEHIDVIRSGKDIRFFKKHFDKMWRKG